MKVYVRYSLTDKYCRQDLTEKADIHAPNSESVFKILNQLLNVQDFKTDCEFVSGDKKQIDAIYYPIDEKPDTIHSILIYFEYRNGDYTITVRNGNSDFTVEIFGTSYSLDSATGFLSLKDTLELKAKLGIV